MLIFLSDNDVFKYAYEKLGKMPEEFEKASDKALKKAFYTLKNHAPVNIRKHFDISGNILKTGTGITVTKFGQGGTLCFNVNFSGKKIPLYRYIGASPIAPEYHVQAKGHQLKTTIPEKIANDVGGAFVATMKSGHTGIFVRDGSKTASGKDAIEEVMASSVPGMLGNEFVVKNVSEELTEVFNKTLLSETERILSGLR